MTDKELQRLKVYINKHKDHISDWGIYVNKYDNTYMSKLNMGRKEDFKKIVKGDNIDGRSYRDVRSINLWARVYINKDRETKVYSF